MRPPPRFLLPAASSLLALILVLAIVLGNSTKGASDGSGASTGFQANGGFAGAVFPPGVRAHDFTLEDQQGRRVSLSSYRGRVVALAFLPASALQGMPVGVSPDCRTCVLVAQQVRGALDELESDPPAKPDLRTVFVSPKPGAPRARGGRLLAQASLTGRVELLTGTTKELRPVWHAYSLPPSNAGKAASEAAITVLLIDRNGFERVGFGLEQMTPEGLSHDIRLLLAG